MFVSASAHFVYFVLSFFFVDAGPPERQQGRRPGLQALQGAGAPRGETGCRQNQNDKTQLDVLNEHKAAKSC